MLSCAPSPNNSVWRTYLVLVHGIFADTRSTQGARDGLVEPLVVLFSLSERDWLLTQSYVAAAVSFMQLECLGTDLTLAVRISTEGT